jgi:hypothetical protein
MQFRVGGFVFWDFAQNLLYVYFVDMLYNEFKLCPNWALYHSNP